MNPRNCATNKNTNDDYSFVNNPYQLSFRMKAYRIILLGLLTILLATAVWAQPETLATTPNPPPQGEVNLPPVNTDLVPTKSSQEIYLSLGVLFFGIIVVLAQAYIINKRQEPLSQSLKYLSVSLIIVGALFLVTAGYGNSRSGR